MGPPAALLGPAARLRRAICTLICTYICLYTLIYVYIRLYMSIYTPIYAYIRLYTPIYAYIYAYMRLYTPIYACRRLLEACRGTADGYKRLYIRVYILIYDYIRLYIRIYTLIYAYTGSTQIMPDLLRSCQISYPLQALISTLKTRKSRLWHINLNSWHSNPCPGTQIRRGTECRPAAC